MDMETLPVARKGKVVERQNLIAPVICTLDKISDKHSSSHERLCEWQEILDIHHRPSTLYTAQGGF
jgi:hypothetical protein